MPSPVLFGCVGGFLGAGKTTALVAAAGELRARGLSVGLVANDQGQDIVDTAVFRGLGVPTAEVAGGCFCCRFDDLMAGAERLLAEQRIDVLLAEAVGSCTDLVATVYRPLHRFFPDRFRLAPFSVLVEPDRIREMRVGGASIPGDVAYLFDRQLAEADLLVLTKVDSLGPSERAEARRSLKTLARDTPVLEVSSTGGEGVASWVDRLLGHGPLADRGLDIDYDAYARGEAALAWLNAMVDFGSPTGLGARSVGEALMAEMGERVRQAGLYVPHVKVLVATSEGSARLALTRGDGPVRWVGDPDLPAENGISVIVNARVVTEPAVLRAIVEDAARGAGARLGASTRIGRLECFSPSRPAPRHRFVDGAPMDGS
jgi:Ni2+-binding GTPase involved in maturation of urease and hydrogenase